MQTFELSLTPTYCSDWTFPMAIRELIQNGTDQESVNPRSRFSMEYNEEANILSFKNLNSRLRISTLLLGQSSKRTDEQTVGQFGEGYKIAALVLNRLNKTFKIYNHAENEIWTCRFKNSKKWHGRILAFFVEEMASDCEDLIIEVGNVTQEEYDDLADIWLGMYSDLHKIQTDYGDILLNEELKGKVFVNGLYIECNADFQYGYNFKPQYLKLERDRKSCDTWDAKQITSDMLAQAMAKGELPKEVIQEMIESDSDDITNIGYSNEPKDMVKAMLEENFDLEHPDSIPVNTQSDFQMIKEYGGNPVIVPYRVSCLLSDVRKERIETLLDGESKDSLSPKERLQRWYDKWKNRLPYGSEEEFKEIIQML